jgi:glycosyltransferase involved in cell wall biosynthesis
MESLTCGRPAVVTKVAGNKEVVVDGETGIFAESCSVESLNKALEKAWGHKSEWGTMGQKAHEWAKENLDPYPVETFYKQIIQD